MDEEDQASYDNSPDNILTNIDLSILLEESVNVNSSAADLPRKVEIEHDNDIKLWKREMISAIEELTKDECNERPTRERLRTTLDLSKNSKTSFELIYHVLKAWHSETCQSIKLDSGKPSKEIKSCKINLSSNNHELDSRPTGAKKQSSSNR